MIEIGKYATGQAVCIDPCESTNGHVLVLGKSGSGKSVWSHKFLLQILNAGGTVLAFDIHRTLDATQLLDSYREKFEANTCEIDAYRDGISCPLFAPIEDSEGESEKALDLIYGVTDIFSRSFKLGSRQRTALRQAIEVVYDNHLFESEGIKSIETVLGCSNDARCQVVQEKIHQITHHNVLKSGDLFLKQGKINIVRLSKLDMSSQELITELILEYFWKMANAKKFINKPIYIFLDEAQNLPFSRGGAIAHFLTEGRKLNVSILLATQSLSSGFSDSQQNQLMQTGLQIIFRPADSEISRIASLIEPNRKRDMCELLKTLKIGEFVGYGAIKIGNNAISKPLKISAKS